MGGPGSGNRIRFGTKDTVEESRRIDVRKLAREDCIRPGVFGQWHWWNAHGEKTAAIKFRIREWYIILNYRYRVNDGQWTDVEDWILFDWTPCNFGGYRWWFRCPECNRRVAILYGAGKYFLCRHCYDLSYVSRQSDPLDRLMIKARKIRRRLGASDVLIEPIASKPKGMHWQTFNRLRAEESYIQRKIDYAMLARFGIRL